MDQTLILDLSSDEEVGFDNSSSADNFDYWITKLLEDDPLNPNNNIINGDTIDDGDDSDDVVVVGEVIVEKPKKIKSLMPRNSDDDDDDCVMLDGDPDKAKDEVVKDNDGDNNNYINNNNDCEKDEDELVIVGEKGQVACRDFPHARHSCAKYPFSSTPHENRCDLCHCYVCDSLAPCAQWGSGLSSTDHCNATDKKEYWKLERTRYRQLKTPSLLPKSVTKASISLPHSPQLHQISRGPNQLLRPSTNNGIPSTLGPPRVSRRHRSSISISSNKFQPNLLARQLMRSCNNGNTQIPGNRGASLSRARLVASCPMFKRSGVTSRPMAAHCELPCRSPNNVSVAYLQMPNQQSIGQRTESKSINSTVSSLHSELNPSFLHVSTSSVSPTTPLNLHLQGYSPTSPHTLTSQYNVYDRSSGLPSNSNPYSYQPMNQSQNVPSVTQNISGPFPGGLGSISQQSHPTSVQQSYSSPAFSCTTSHTLNSVSPSFHESVVENSLVRGVVPIQELLPSIEPNGPPSSNDTEPPLVFDMDYWLQDDGPVLDLFDENNQASVHEPVDAGMLYFDFETSMKGLTHL